MSNNKLDVAGERDFSIFCVESDGSAFTWIGEAIAATAQEAVRLGRAQCADAWGVDEDAVRVQGVATGNFRVVAWSDEGCLASDGVEMDSAPAEQEFTVFLVNDVGPADEPVIGTATGATPREAAERFREKTLALPQYKGRRFRVMGIARGDVDVVDFDPCNDLLAQD